MVVQAVGVRDTWDRLTNFILMKKKKRLLGLKSKCDHLLIYLKQL